MHSNNWGGLRVCHLLVFNHPIRETTLVISTRNGHFVEGSLAGLGVDGALMKCNDHMW